MLFRRFAGRLLKCWPELQIVFMQLARKGSPPPGLRLPQAKLSRNSNQIARGRIRQFESYMPSQAVVSNSGGCRYTNGDATTAIGQASIAVPVEDCGFCVSTNSRSNSSTNPSRVPG
jgi:hypothetical protein